MPLIDASGLWSSILKWTVVQRIDQSSALLASSGQLRLAGIDPSLQVVTASVAQGSSSRSFPLQLEADPRALPPAPAALALIPLLVLLVLALRPKSRFRDWCRTSFEDFVGLFRPIRRRRHVIHDKPYLDRVLKAEFGGRPPSASHPSSGSPPASVSRSSEKLPVRESFPPPPPEDARDRSS